MKAKSYSPLHPGARQCQAHGGSSINTCGTNEQTNERMNGHFTLVLPDDSAPTPMDSRQGYLS